jgi:hypothetical protein
MMAVGLQKKLLPSHCAWRFRRFVGPGSFFGRICRTSFLCGEFLGELVGVHGVLVRLLAKLVSSEMVSFAVGGSGGRVGMGGKVVEFRRRDCASSAAWCSLRKQSG